MWGGGGGGVVSCLANRHEVHRLSGTSRSCSRGLGHQWSFQTFKGNSGPALARGRSESSGSLRLSTPLSAAGPLQLSGLVPKRPCPRLVRVLCLSPPISLSLSPSLGPGEWPSPAQPGAALLPSLVGKPDQGLPSSPPAGERGSEREGQTHPPSSGSARIGSYRPGPRPVRVKGRERRERERGERVRGGRELERWGRGSC